MKIRIKALILAMVFVLTFILASCNGMDEGQSQNKKVDDKIKIGLSFDSFIIERWQRDRDVFVSAAKELGAEVNVQNANGVLEEQKNQIKYLIEEKMDVIVIIAIDGFNLSEEVQMAKDKGIKVIAYDRLICNADVDLYISFDNEMVGTLMGQAMVDNGIGGKSVIMLGGSDSDNNVVLVEEGFKKVMRSNNVKILDTMHAAGWKAELAADYIRENFDTVSRVQGIMCGNDNLASAVVPVLAEKRLAGDIMVVGQDADLEACQRIVEGTQLMTVYKPVERLAQRAAECAVKLAKGEEITSEEGYSSMNDGTYDVPYIALEPLMVTEENMDEVIIASGFHLKEDVYLNVPDKSE